MPAQRKINVMFYKPPESDPWLNRLVSWFDPPYSHAELCFEDGTAASIFNGETVFVQKRSFSNPNYTIVTLSVPERRYDDILTFCTKSHRNNVGFDRVGMFTALIPVYLVPQRDNVTFCSRFVTEALQAGAVPEVVGVNSMKVTPSRLHKLLQTKKSQIVDTVAGRYHRLTM